MIEKIKNLNNKDTFYNDVRALLKNKHYSDATIKNLQRVADTRYDELKEAKKWKSLSLLKLTSGGLLMM